MIFFSRFVSQHIFVQQASKYLKVSMISCVDTRVVCGWMSPNSSPHSRLVWFYIFFSMRFNLHQPSDDDTTTRKVCLFSFYVQLSLIFCRCQTVNICYSYWLDRIFNFFIGFGCSIDKITVHLIWPVSSRPSHNSQEKSICSRSDDAAQSGKDTYRLFHRHKKRSSKRALHSIPFNGEKVLTIASLFKGPSENPQRMKFLNLQRIPSSFSHNMQFHIGIS